MPLDSIQSYRSLSILVHEGESTSLMNNTILYFVWTLPMKTFKTCSTNVLINQDLNKAVLTPAIM